MQFEPLDHMGKRHIGFQLMDLLRILATRDTWDVCCHKDCLWGF